MFVSIISPEGAGKYSITMAVFRILEAESGSIIFNGLDISKLGLHDLRSKLTIIPQVKTLLTPLRWISCAEDR